jgi:hypothetical protein
LVALHALGNARDVEQILELGVGQPQEIGRVCSRSAEQQEPGHTITGCVAPARRMNLHTPVEEAKLDENPVGSVVCCGRSR